MAMPSTRGLFVELATNVEARQRKATLRLSGVTRLGVTRGRN